MSGFVPNRPAKCVRATASAMAWLAMLIAFPALGGVFVPGEPGSGGEPAHPAPPARPGKRAAPHVPAISLGSAKASATSLLVRLRPASRSAAASVELAVSEALGREGLKIGRSYARVRGLKRVDLAGSAGGHAFTRRSLEASIKRLRATGLFEYVEPDWQVGLLLNPTDAAFASGDLWGLRNYGQDGGTAGIDVNAVEAWNLSTGSSAVVVGVVDSGIRYTHQDITRNMWRNPGEIAGNATDDDGDGYIDDVYGINAVNDSGDPFDDNNHGTHVAGTIAASGFDAGPVVGVAFNARLMALKFLTADGYGYTSAAIECIEYAIEHGADILNNSWGGGGYSYSLRDAVRAANDAGILFIAAAGNSSNDNDIVPHYPSSYDVENIVAVAAIDRDGGLANFSSYGATSVDVAAPGVFILSAIAASNSSYAYASGTSMATPHVAGVAALLRSRFPNAGISELKNRLLIGARALPSVAGHVASGGMVDAAAALALAADGRLELRAGSDGALEGGEPGAFRVSVTDLLPVTGATVTGGLSDGASATFFDDGLGPDTAAGDGIYSAILAVPAGVASVTLNVQATAPGKLPAAAQFSFPVIAPPPNDDFADRVVLAGGTSQATGTNRFASAEPGEPINPFVAGGKTVWWQWRAPASGVFTISTTGSNYDTTLAIYRGTSLPGLVLLGANDDTYGLQSSVTFAATADTVYQVQVDGYAGNTGDIQLNYPPPGSAGTPVIVTQPVGRTVLVGESFSLSVTATGEGTLSYQWSLNGTPIPGAVSAVYSVAAAAEPDQGSYTVAISNSAGSVVSNPAFVAVDQVGLRPANDDFGEAMMLPGTSGRVNGTNVRATGEPGEPDHAATSAPLASVWFTWTAPSSGLVALDTFGSDYDTTLALYEGTTLQGLSLVAENDDSSGAQSAVFTTVSAGVTYRVAVDGHAAEEGQLVLNYLFASGAAAPLNDDFADRAVLATDETAVSTNVGAGGETGEPSHAGVSVPLASTWWSWTAPGDGRVTINTFGSDFDTTLAAYTGAAVDALTEIAANDNYSGAQSRISFAVTRGMQYAIAVDGYATSEGVILLRADFDSAPVVPDGAVIVPRIHGEPSNTVALLREGSVQVELRRARDGLSYFRRTFFSDPSVPLPRGIVGMPDFNGNGWGEIGAVGMNAAGDISVTVVDGGSRDEISRAVMYRAGFEPIALAWVRDMTGNEVPELAQLARRVSNDTKYVKVKDALTGERIGNDAIYFLGPGFTALDLVRLPAIDGSGADELVVFGTRDADGRALVEIRAADGTGERRRIWFLDSRFTPLAIAVGDDADGSGVPEIAMLAERDSDGRIVIERRNASGVPNASRHWYFGPGWLALDFVALADTDDADALPEYAVLAVRPDGKPAVEIRNAGFPKVTFRRFFMDERFVPAQLIDLGDTNANGVTNLGVLGVREVDERILLESRDARGAANRVGVWFTP